MLIVLPLGNLPFGLTSEGKEVLPMADSIYTEPGASSPQSDDRRKIVSMIGRPNRRELEIEWQPLRRVRMFAYLRTRPGGIAA